ncbi:MAG: hypothetical protein BRC31_04215, partial [Actinobacteria bacterium QS_5_72_10]
MKCPLCGQDVLRAGVTSFVADAGGTVVVRNVPADVCAECGEAVINEDVSDDDGHVGHRRAPR